MASTGPNEYRAQVHPNGEWFVSLLRGERLSNVAHGEAHTMSLGENEARVAIREDRRRRERIAAYGRAVKEFTVPA